jgi:tRNA pseudouridine55 synthase
MPKVLNLYKYRGETPLQRIERYRKDNPEFKNVPLSYAGRLDPMAEGVLLVLAGEENKKREEYLGLEKEYLFDVLFGFATDTYDLLGVMTDAVTRASHKPIKVPLLTEYVSQMPGNLPEHQIEIYEAALVGTKRITDEELQKTIEQSITSVKGDFRQERILSLWQESLRVMYGMEFDVATISIRCSSGTYVRSLANELGEKLGVPALASRIQRTRVGKWKVRGSVK